MCMLFMLLAYENGHFSASSFLGFVNLHCFLPERQSQVYLVVLSCLMVHKELKPLWF